MKRKPRRTFPAYHKLLLENKIMLLFTVLLLMLGAALLAAQYWVTRDTAGRLVGELPALAPDGAAAPGEEFLRDIDRLSIRAVWMVDTRRIVLRPASGRSIGPAEPLTLPSLLTRA